jgi:hypothetical protein
MTTLQQTIAEIVLLVLTLVQPRSNCWHLMWLMAANVFLILPSNLKSTEYKNKLDDWILAVTSAKMFVKWNRFSKSHNEPLFKPELLNLPQDWKKLRETFQKCLKNSAVKRTKLEG